MSCGCGGVSERGGTFAHGTSTSVESVVGKWDAKVFRVPEGFLYLVALMDGCTDGWMDGNLFSSADSPDTPPFFYLLLFFSFLLSTFVP